MKTILLPLVLALTGVAAQAAEIEPLTLDPTNNLMCNEAQDWCVSVDAQDGPQAESRTLQASYFLWDQPDVPDFSQMTAWPQIIRLSEDRALVGVLAPRRDDFSGGSFEAQDLYLFDVTLGENSSSNSALLLPYASDISIRACFTPEDETKRLGHCLDEYSYRAELKPTADGADLPDLVLTTQATRSPAGASRTADSSALPALTEDQFQPQTDATCSFTRTFHWEADEGLYQPDAPLPNCHEFTEAASDQ